MLPWKMECKSIYRGIVRILSIHKLLFLGFLAGSSWALAQSEARPFVHAKTYVLPSGTKVAVTFRERHCTGDECSEVDSGMWGIDGGIPPFVTETFIVLIDGERFVIPEKFYKDLTNTHSMQVSEQNERIIIEIKGGDATGAYTARFFLGGMCGFERKICGEICNEMWERTIWYNSFAYSRESQCTSRIR